MVSICLVWVSVVVVEEEDGVGGRVERGCLGFLNAEGKKVEKGEGKRRVGAIVRKILRMRFNSMRETRRTFSSSLRFSLRFLRRRAISARRMACSSAVRCFLV